MPSPSRSAHEPKVLHFTPVPPGYRHVPKGNIYITKNCRLLTHAAKQPLYVVVDKRNRTLGIHCPDRIYRQVLSSYHETAPKRAQAVQKRDALIEDKFEAIILKLFPKTPKASIPVIVKHAVKKRSGRVGRSTKIGELEDKVMLAVRAHIRHVHTDYEMLLREGVNREEARQRVWERVNEVAREWGAATRSLFRKRVNSARGKTVSRDRPTGAAPDTGKKRLHRPVITKRIQVTAPETASPLDQSATEPPGRKQKKRRGRYTRFLERKARGGVMAISPDRVRVTRRMTRQSLEKSSAEANDGVEVIEISSDEDGDEDGDVLEDDPIKVFIVDNDDEEALAVFSVDEDTSDIDYESDDSGWSGKS
ncbi:hypothetical protein QC761_711620 [Podospora bellae-mahoneyi]|uniref:DUF2293 domain-containing protein n=1 Tax=Podospora bellae-mahoneyi TaxID=2093777 RepID=A0ABR0F712_9PEZI|nr:hypothetical protein QC761_711620 [Podospora bellae-mahoneyi]